MKHYLSGFIRHKLSGLLAGTHTNSTPPSHKKLQRATLRNQLLANEINRQATKHSGQLSFSEYISLEQYGKSGYHTTHKQHGETTTASIWSDAILKILKKNNLNSVVEFGSGDGEMGFQLLSKATKHEMKIDWTGIEINDVLLAKTAERMRRVARDKWHTAKNIHEVSNNAPALYTFPYCLDSIPPELFINSKKEQSIPTDLIGIKMHGREIREILLSDKDLRDRRITFSKGKLTTGTGFTYDMQNVPLHPMQRLYFPLHALNLLLEIAFLMPEGSQILIIDEFLPIHPLNSQSIALPKSLYTYRRIQNNLETFYSEAGERLLYFPYFLHTSIKLLGQIGLAFLFVDIDKRAASKIIKKAWRPQKLPYFTIALLTKPKIQTRKPETFLLPPHFAPSFLCQ